MPAVNIPAAGDDVVVKLAAKVAELESSGAINVKIAQVGNQYVLTYDMKPRVGRPPKTETR